MKQVLYISYDGMTDPLGQSQVLPYLKSLSKLGYQFTILSFEKKDRFEKERKLIEAITSSNSITWVPLTFTTQPPVLAKIWDRYKMWRTALKLQKKNSYDLIHCRSYLAAEVGLKLKKKFGVKFLFDMRGFWADERVDNGQWNLGHPLYKLLYKRYKKKEKQFLSNADGIVTLTAASKNYLNKNSGLENLPIDVIPCCADLAHFDYHKVSDENKNALRRSLNIPSSTKILVYQGSVGGWYMTREMFLFFRMLQERSPEYGMLVLTNNEKERVKKEMIDAGIPENRFWVSSATRNELPAYLSLSNCGIFFIRNSFSKIASSPTKHAELMGMGIPVICNDIGDTGVIVNDTQTGYVVSDISEKGFSCAIEKIPAVENIDKNYIRSCAKKIFDLQTGVDKYSAVYQKILG